MRLVDAAERVFARHETFHPRYGWFRKAYACVKDEPRAFVLPDAPIRMGVGKNMVRAIRFWGTAAKVIERSPARRGSRSGGMVQTELGHRLFAEDGWDPYLEEPASLWMLHWLLLAKPCQLPVWWVAFNEFHAVEFDDRQLERVIMSRLELAVEWKLPHLSSIRKDMRALLRTYTPVASGGRGGIDDILDCPLRELGLIGRSEAKDGYRFSNGAKSTLPAAMVAFAAMDHVARTDPGRSVIAISRLAQEAGGPGRTLRLAESDLHAAMASVAAQSPLLDVVTVMGAPQLSWSGSPSEVATEILDAYYHGPGDRSSDDEVTG